MTSFNLKDVVSALKATSDVLTQFNSLFGEMDKVLDNIRPDLKELESELKSEDNKTSTKNCKN